MADSTQPTRVPSIRDEIQARFEASLREQAQAQESKSGSWLGAIITLLVIAVLITGGLYIWGKHLVETDGTTPTEIIQNDPQLGALQTQGDSDELDSIEADLDQSDMSALDSDMENIEREYTN